MTDQEMGTISQYRALACEIALYAFNDYIRYRYNLFCLEHPDENDFTAKRYTDICKQIVRDIKDNLGRAHDADAKEVTKAFYRELPFRKSVLQSKIEDCKKFFSTPLAGLLGLDAETIKHGDDIVETWIATGKVCLMKSVRAERSAHGKLLDMETR